MASVGAGAYGWMAVSAAVLRVVATKAAFFRDGGGTKRRRRFLAAPVGNAPGAAWIWRRAALVKGRG